MAQKEARIESMERDLARLKESETVKERLLYMTIHDLKNPLSLVISNLAYLEDMDLGAEAEDVLRLSRFGCERLLDMIKGCLDSHKMDLGDFRLHASCFDLAHMAREVIKEFSIVARFDEITIKYEGPESIHVNADGGVIRRVLTNLLDNAVRHSPIGGSVGVGVRSDAGDVLLSVKDEGEGVADEDREKIFDAFEQARSSIDPSKKASAYGLGLAFCKMAAKAHKGDIWVESEPGKRGARFVFSIPGGLVEEG